MPVAERAKSWKFDTYGMIKTSPAVTDKMVYVVGDSASCSPWTAHAPNPLGIPAGRQGTYISSPVVALGKVFVGTEKDGFIALGSQQPPKPPVPR